MHMDGFQITALVLMALFYLAYFAKMLRQRMKGVQTDQIAKGGKSKAVLRTELLMKLATYGIVPVEVISITWNVQWLDGIFCWIGAGIAAVGVLVFVVAMTTMRDSWRAGIPEKDKTELITAGIYRFSRNPAFLGFDLMYLGLLLAYFSPIHLLFAGFAVSMLHMQILQEEVYLSGKFGAAYLKYKQQTRRYF